eukprot:2750070-Alexandrium_andersonii.AAC.1
MATHACPRILCAGGRGTEVSRTLSPLELLKACPAEGCGTRLGLLAHVELCTPAGAAPKHRANALSTGL